MQALTLEMEQTLKQTFASARAALAARGNH
jgi:hypothetical protein